MKKILSLILVSILLVVSFYLGKTHNEKGNYVIDYQDVTNNIQYGDIAYVIGHKSPDTDTVVSSIAYATLKNELGINCKSVVSGKINNETLFVLNYFDVSIPEVLDNAKGKNIIIVDHSSYMHAIDGMKEANIVEIIDHHSLGDFETASPLFIRTLPIGATATIVYTLFIENNVKIDKTTAGLLLAGILSDTNSLSSSSTTTFDTNAYNNLVKLSEINDIETFYKNMLEKLNSYENMSDSDIFYSDYKEYDMNNTKVGISSINVTDENEDTLSKEIQEFMINNYKSQQMEHLYLLINNHNSNKSSILYYGEGTEDIVMKAFGSSERINFDYILSRKLDVVPMLESAYKTIE